MLDRMRRPSESSHGGRAVPTEDFPGADKEAAGKPAANSTGRHHNVREDIGLAIAEPLTQTSADITTKPRRV
jgi:hypothetical protein